MQGSSWTVRYVKGTSLASTTTVQHSLAYDGGLASSLPSTQAHVTQAVDVLPLQAAAQDSVSHNSLLTLGTSSSAEAHRRSTYFEGRFEGRLLVLVNALPYSSTHYNH